MMVTLIACYVPSILVNNLNLRHDTRSSYYSMALVRARAERDASRNVLLENKLREDKKYKIVYIQ